MGNDLDLVVVLPNIGRISVREARAKGLLNPPPHGLLGREFTAEHCANLSKALTGKEKTPEHCINIGKARRLSRI